MFILDRYWLTNCKPHSLFSNKFFLNSLLKFCPQHLAIYVDQEYLQVLVFFCFCRLLTKGDEQNLLTFLLFLSLHHQPSIGRTIYTKILKCNDQLLECREMTSCNTEKGALMLQFVFQPFEAKPLDLQILCNLRS